MERQDVVPSLHWDRESILKLTEQICRNKMLPEPRLLRFSNAAVLTAGPDVIVRVDDTNRKVWLGEPLVMLVDHLVSHGVRTPATMKLSTETVDGFCFSFYRRIDDDESLDEKSKTERFGAELKKLHECPIELPETIDTEKITVDHVKGMFDRLKTADKNGLWKRTCLTDDDLSFLSEKIGSLQKVLYSDLYWEKNSFVLLHGDAHLGNTIVNNGKLFLIDFEYVSYGPAFLDHLHILLSDSVFGTQLYKDFAKGYSANFSLVNNLAYWVQLVAIPYIVWTASVGLISESHRSETARRIEWLKADRPEILWTSGF